MHSVHCTPRPIYYIYRVEGSADGVVPLQADAEGEVDAAGEGDVGEGEQKRDLLQVASARLYNINIIINM